ncbi:FR47-like protein [Actinacidiphila rubida]|uniref:FR47-like protein n=1 Tax=Actinacidiphila rubida TaxID=310780 RepID=A0A1H8SMT7_9ACTN|nr:GNAT family N-acetyltransferase [Actinacidiphila rubida]SEO79826.1 FR47-like protein [Actinacidiphila rubida]
MDTTVQNFAVANLRRRPVVIENPSFVAGFDPATTSPYVNYASPLPGAEPTRREVAHLVAAFRERGLRPRVEFALSTAPAVEPALRAAGFTTEEVHEYLVCTPATLTMPPPAARDSAFVPRARTPHTDEEFDAIDAALAEAFGSEFDASPEGGARLRRIQDAGGVIRFVPSPGGGCAGAASCSAPAAGTGELSGVGTRPAFRGRGVAAVVTAEVAAEMFARGARSVWLESSGDGPRRIYERLGFRPEGTRLYLSISD